MLTTHSPATREPTSRAPQTCRLTRRSWQQTPQIVRKQHPSLSRTWFDDMLPRQLSNGVIQARADRRTAQFLPEPVQQPFTSAAQQVTARLIAVSFHCPICPKRVFSEDDKPCR